MTAPEITVRRLVPADHDAWRPLWAGYHVFYERSPPWPLFDITWARFHDPAEPMVALGAFSGDKLVGITHLILHRSCLSEHLSCYLQDLFVDETVRGAGIGRKLIEAAYDHAKAHGADRVHWLTHETNADARLLYDRIADRSGFIQYRKLL